MSSSPSINSNDEIKETYKKISHKDHVLLAPDTYVGSTERHTENLYVYDNSDEFDRIINKEVTYVPALYKIFDEVVVNATDQCTRMKQNKDGKQVTSIKINIDTDNNQIEVYNNGEGISVVYLDEYECYAPELIFGTLLTSSNYNKDEEKTVGGKNGYGAKLANIFSKKFIIETVDSKNKKKFIQEYSNNMNDKSEPKITRSTGQPYTKITFEPELERFNMDRFDDDIVSIMKKRAYDISAWTDKTVTVQLNGKKIECKTFEKYVDLYLGDKIERPRIYQQINDRWEIVATYSDDDVFQQVSFVNGINTVRGGKHVEYISDQIRDKLVEYMHKRKKLTVKSNIIKNQLMVFVKAVIVNPSFDSQTKETLTTSKASFGSKCDIPNTFIDKLFKTAIVDKIIAQSEFKNNTKLKKTDGKKQKTLLGIPKLSDANKAGTKESKECTLILTEGDSARTTAITGLSEVGRDLYGVFPLRGKPLNVKDADVEKMLKNTEIGNIKTILGLKTNNVYDTTNISELRYGKLVIMTDQDVDGSHIKGLIMNIFHSHWKSLLKVGYISSLLTPIVKVTKHVGKKEKSFYNLTDFDYWRNSNNGGKGWTIKYYKGLGTSNSKEAKEYFKNMNLVKYTWNEESDEAIDKAFNPKRPNDRKEWLSGWDKNNIIKDQTKCVTYNDFVDRELIHFSQADNKRSIPSISDGLKVSLRKILYSCFKRNLKTEIKVAQLAGYVSEHSAYHHGEASLQGAIVGMAQYYTGTNNMNLLYPSGQFGTRLQGGKDSASCRYIFTRLNDFTRKIYREEDDQAYTYLDDDGFPVEPEYYCPIIPMILVNGTKGIGTGWSTHVPQHNPIDVIDAVIKRINGETTDILKPWYNGFKGEIEAIEENKYNSHGVYSVDGDILNITELPLGKWTDDFKAFIETDIMSKKNNIKSYVDNSTDKDVDFTIEFYPGIIDKLKMKEKKYCNGLEEYLKLTSMNETCYTNMNIYDRYGHIKKYNNTNEIITDYMDIRNEMYIKRKKIQLKKIDRELDILINKVKFIEGIINDKVDLRKKTHEQMITHLEEHAFAKLHINFEIDEGTYEYLIHMPMYSLTVEKAEELKNKCDNKQNEYDVLLKKTIQEIWLEELDELTESYNKYLNMIKKEENVGVKVKKQIKIKKPVKTK